MKAEIINIGDEILIGQINNTNSQWLAQKLRKVGVDTIKISVISDGAQDIVNTLQNTQADMVIVTGGLGPTLDDITRQTITDFFDDELIYNSDIEQHIKKMFAKMNYPYTDNNKGQSYLPSKAEVLWNACGTAPGMWIENNKKTYIFMPGVPFEMKQIFENEALPKIKERFDLPILYHKTVTVFGIGESFLAARINSWEKQLPKELSLAYLPHPGRIRLRLSVKGDNKNELEKIVQQEIDKLKLVIPDLTISEQVENLVIAVHQKLSKINKTIAFAESCTGGRLVSDLAQISGASAFLKGGVVAYDTQVKIDILHVDKELIDKYSVVHEKVAEAMALQVRKLLKSDIGVATTGNAGPSKGDSNADIGTCIVAIADEFGIKSYRFLHGQPREKAVNRTVSKVFELLLNY